MKLSLVVLVLLMTLSLSDAFSFSFKSGKKSKSAKKSSSSFSFGSSKKSSASFGIKSSGSFGVKGSASIKGSALIGAKSSKSVGTKSSGSIGIKGSSGLKIKGPSFKFGVSGKASTGKSLSGSSKFGASGKVSAGKSLSGSLGIKGSTHLSSKGKTSQCFSDVVFLLDSSLSVTWQQFDSMKNFVVKTTDATKRYGKSKGLQVAVYRYSDPHDTYAGIRLGDYKDVQRLKFALYKLHKKGYMSYMGTALKQVRTEAYEAKNGGRNEAKRVAVLLTDGTSSDSVTTANEIKYYQNEGIKVIVVSIGSDKEAASSLVRDEKLLHDLSSYKDLPNVISTVADQICEGPSRKPNIRTTSSPKTTAETISTTKENHKYNQAFNCNRTLYPLDRDNKDVTFKSSSHLLPVEQVIGSLGYSTKRFQFTEKDWRDHHNGGGVFIEWHVHNADENDVTFVTMNFIAVYADIMEFQGSTDGKHFTTYKTLKITTKSKSGQLHFPGGIKGPFLRVVLKGGNPAPSPILMSLLAEACYTPKAQKTTVAPKINTTKIHSTKEPLPECDVDPKTDIIFGIDISKRIKNPDWSRLFATNVIQELLKVVNYGSTGAKFGVTVFAGSEKKPELSDTVNFYQSEDANQVFSSVKSLKNSNQVGSPLKSALEHLHSISLSTQNGARSNAKRILVLVADAHGRDATEFKKTLQYMKEENIAIMVVHPSDVVSEIKGNSGTFSSDNYHEVVKAIKMLARQHRFKLTNDI